MNLNNVQNNNNNDLFSFMNQPNNNTQTNK